MKKKVFLLLAVAMPYGVVVSGCTPTTNPGDVHHWKENWSFDANYHWKECEDCSELEGKTLHTWDEGQVTTPASETEEGVKTYTCSCGATTTESIPVTGSTHTHSWASEYSYDVDYHWFECASCDDEKAKAAHDWDNGVITKEATETEEGVKTYTCSVCKGVKTEAVKYKHTHVWRNNYESDDNYHWRPCGGCQDITDKNGHDWDNGVVTTPATATANGVKTYTCTVCDKKITEVIPATGGTGDDNQDAHKHTWNDGVVTKEPTTTERGEKLYTCTTCNKTQTIQLAKLGTETKSQPDPDSRWNLNFTEYGNTFRDTLAVLMTAKVTAHTTYSACLGIGENAASAGKGYYIPFYHNEKHATSEPSNREHTWPNSRGGGKNAGGNAIEQDPYMVRPTLEKDNSARGNNFYGTGSKEWDPASCGFEGARGESARVIFYVATKYGKSHGLSLSNNPGDSTGKKTMGTLKTLVEWNKVYPVTDTEKQINDYLEKAGFGRNPFVDHPEYVDYIWDKDGVVTSAPTSITFGDYVDDKLEEYEGGGAKTTGYTLKDALNDIDSAYIVSSSDGVTYNAMTANTKGESLPWYIDFVETNVSSDKSTCFITAEGAEEYKFKKQSDGSYTIQTSDNKYLFSYIDGTHYSIGLSSTTTDVKGGTVYWNITKNGIGYTFKGTTTNVYLKQYLSFCGDNKVPEIPLYLYVKDNGTTGGTTTGGTTTGGSTTGGSTTGGSTTGGSTTGGGTSTGGTTGGGTTTGGSTGSQTYNYSKITDLDDLDGENAYIVMNDKAMTSVNPSAKLPWYFNPVDPSFNADKSSMNVTGAEKWAFEKQDDGIYTIQAADGNYLYSYIDGSHYSISISKTESAKYFTIETNGDGYAIKGSTTGVYVSIGNPSFTGVQNKPTTPIYLYK